MNFRKAKLIVCKKNPIYIAKVTEYKYFGTWLTENFVQNKEIRIKIAITPFTKL